MTCSICDAISKRDGVLFEDDKIVVMLAQNPAATGHMMILPKSHAPIIEKVPDFVVDSMFVAANKASFSLFESLGALGTNVLLQNGPAAGQSENHVILHVIPRFENDGLSFEWKPRQVSEDQLKSIAGQLSGAASRTVGIIEKEKPKPLEEKKPEEVGKGDWREKYLRRIP
ncbi:HIT family protein [Candidatus Woesearchaeota archaeon]|nr:MAG: HIT family protein [Candidatus Woesearchaeota archaeon]